MTLPSEGTSWQLVRFQGGDGAVLVPDEKIEIHADVRRRWRDARAHRPQPRDAAAWKSAARRDQLEFGPMAITRARVIRRARCTISW